MTKEEIKTLAKNGVVTHAGQFHADDVLSAALLEIAGICKIEDVKRVFKVDPEFKGLAFDIGGGRFDHHQVGAEMRPEGGKYAAFGLIWRDLGSSVMSSEKAASKFDKEFVQEVDMTDNYGQEANPNTISYLVSACAATAKDLDQEFIYTAKGVKFLIEKAIENCEKKSQLEDEAAKLAEEQGPVVVLDHFISAVCFKGTPAKYIVSESNRGGWNINCVPGTKIKLSREQMDGCIFKHPAGFLAAFESKDYAVKAAQNNLTLIQ